MEESEAQRPVTIKRLELRPSQPSGKPCCHNDQELVTEESVTSADTVNAVVAYDHCPDFIATHSERYSDQDGFRQGLDVTSSREG